MRIKYMYMLTFFVLFYFTGTCPGVGPQSHHVLFVPNHPQNRNAQRAFRERKEKVLRDLEDKVNELKEMHDTSQSENQSGF